MVATYTSNKNARVHRIQTNAVRTLYKSCALGRNPVAQGVPTIAANLGIEGTAELLQMCRFQRKLRVCSVHSSAEAAAFAHSSLAGLHDLLLHSNTNYIMCQELAQKKETTQPKLRHSHVPQLCFIRLQTSTHMRCIQRVQRSQTNVEC